MLETENSLPKGCETSVFGHTLPRNDTSGTNAFPATHPNSIDTRAIPAIPYPVSHFRSQTHEAVRLWPVIGRLELCSFPHNSSIRCHQEDRSRRPHKDRRQEGRTSPSQAEPQ